MALALIILIFISSLYVGWILHLCLVWSEIPNNPKTSHASNHLTILIPFRNESQHLSQLWNSILPQLRQCPGAEIIFINDHSSDASEAIIDGFNKDYPRLRCVAQESTFGKKHGVDLGVKNALTHWIVCIDADTELPEYWLQAVAGHTAENTRDLLILPLHIGPAENAIGKLQEVEFLSVMGVTAAMAFARQPVLCNGANLCFTKAAYLEVRAKRNDFHITGGDDLFLLHALKHRQQIAWIHDPKTIVSTKPHGQWGPLLAQRLRWMGKTSKMDDADLRYTAALTFTMNAVACIFWCILVMHAPTAILLSPFILAKIIADALLIFMVGKWMCIKQVKRFYLVLIFLYPFYATLLPVISQIYRPAWKGRTTHIRNSAKHRQQ